MWSAGHHLLPNAKPRMEIDVGLKVESPTDMRNRANGTYFPYWGHGMDEWGGIGWDGMEWNGWDGVRANKSFCSKLTKLI